MIVPANKPEDEIKFRWIAIGLAITFVFAAIATNSYPHVGSVDAAIIYATVNVTFLTACTWLLLKWGHLKRRRQKRRRCRSPWGEQRTEEPSPYQDRLTAFVATAREAMPDGMHGDEPASKTADGTIGDPTFRSRMNYWSAVDVPRDPEPPKPTWFIRRVLRRIREALIGYQR